MESSRVSMNGMRHAELRKVASDALDELDRLKDLSDAVGAVARVQALAAKFERDADAGGPAAPVARAIAIEIRNALDL